MWKHKEKWRNDRQKVMLSPGAKGTWWDQGKAHGLMVYHLSGAVASCAHLLISTPFYVKIIFGVYLTYWNKGMEKYISSKYVPNT